MTIMTLAEANTQLTTVNSAIEQFVQGKRLTSLKVGSGAFQRSYDYTDLTLEALKAHRQELLQIIDNYEGNLPTFRINATIPLIVRREVY